MIPRARTNIFHIIKEIILGWGTAWHGKGQRYGTCLLCLTKIFVYNNSGSPLARPTAVKISFQMRCTQLHLQWRNEDSASHFNMDWRVKP
jgi:hypothetical protein